MSTASNNDSAKAKERKLTVTVIEPIAVRMEKELGHAPEKLRVAAYARVSTEQEEQQNSYEAQVSYYTDYIQSNPNWVFKGVLSPLSSPKMAAATSSLKMGSLRK